MRQRVPKFSTSRDRSLSHNITQRSRHTRCGLRSILGLNEEILPHGHTAFFCQDQNDFVARTLTQLSL